VSGLAKRRLYKPERKAPRKKGVLYNCAPIGCPDANVGEVAKALIALGSEVGVKIGQGSGYDGLRDKYYVVGVSRATGKAQDFTFEGEVVAALIRLARRANGGPMRAGRPR
jgi:hypothetical protein